MRPGRPAWWAVRAAGAALLLALLLAAGAPAAAASPAKKRSFGFRVHSRDRQLQGPSFRRSLLRNTTMPLHGAVKDYGYFYATLYLGTPAKKFAVIVDTGSTMTYVPCSNCGSGCGPNHAARGEAAFDPEASATASLITCASPKCNCGSPRCGCSAQQCTYQRSYAEQSSSSGILLEDMLALHDGQPGAPIIFGCETRETGEIYKQRADGLFGLGNSDASVVNQLVKAGVIDDVFSLCFGMVEGDGALLLGDAEVPGSIALQYTPLVPSATHPFYYNVKMLSLAVDGQLLPVSQSLFDQGYGTVLDSGTTFTYMPTPVFQAFKIAVESYALSHKLRRVPGPDPQYEDICFGDAPSHNDLEALSQVFPSMEIQFDQGTSLVLGPLNYLFVHTFNSGKYCLGVFDNGRAGTLLGGITFRNVLVQYDRANRRVGFGPAPCKELGEMQRPPCSFFGMEGSGDITAVDAAKDGDCSVEPMRQQQQETFDPDDDLLEQQAAAEAAADQQRQREAEAAAAAGGHGARRPPGEQPAGQGKPTQQQQQQQQQQDKAGEGQKKGQGQHAHMADAQASPGSSSGSAGAGDQPQQQQQQPEQQDQQQQAETAGTVVVPSIRGGSGGTSKPATGGSSSLSSVAIGMLVSVVAVLSLGFAVALLQPATRERIRGLFGGSRAYRTLTEDEHDPEGGNFVVPTSAAANGLSNGTAGDGSAVGPALELSGVGGKSEYSRGITTPTKLQRTVSNNSNAEELALTAAGMGTPRSGSPNRL
ncbi:hypothetical protein ABPG75_000086 [Micractinium tetrahymenae]